MGEPSGRSWFSFWSVGRGEKQAVSAPTSSRHKGRRLLAPSNSSNDSSVCQEKPPLMDVVSNLSSDRRLAECGKLAVTVVGAHDLRAEPCVNPYVTVSVSGCPQRTSRVVQQTADPLWKESFDFFVDNVQEPTTITFAVMHSRGSGLGIGTTLGSALGSEVLGRVELTLNDLLSKHLHILHTTDTVEADEIFPLKGKSSSTGTLHLKLAYTSFAAAQDQVKRTLAQTDSIRQEVLRLTYFLFLLQHVFIRILQQWVMVSASCRLIASSAVQRSSAFTSNALSAILRPSQGIALLSSLSSRLLTSPVRDFAAAVCSTVGLSRSHDSSVQHEPAAGCLLVTAVSISGIDETRKSPSIISSASGVLRGLFGLVWRTEQQAAPTESDPAPLMAGEPCEAFAEISVGAQTSSSERQPLLGGDMDWLTSLPFWIQHGAPCAAASRSRKHTPERPPFSNYATRKNQQTSPRACTTMQASDAYRITSSHRRVVYFAPRAPYGKRALFLA